LVLRLWKLRRYKNEQYKKQVMKSNNVSSPAKNLVINTSELLVDKVLEDGLLKEIPIINTIISICKIPHSISDTILFNKLNIFLNDLKSIDKKDIKKMMNKLENENFKIKVSSYVLELMNKADHPNKAKMIARVFVAYIEKEIDYEMLYRLNKIILHISSIDISKVRNIFDDTNKNKLTKYLFASIGLIAVTATMDGNAYNENDIYLKFIELDLDLV
jgi:hypothetical protein